MFHIEPNTLQVQGVMIVYSAFSASLFIVNKRRKIVHQTNKFIIAARYDKPTIEGLIKHPIRLTIKQHFYTKND